ncbi:testis-specific H1 histone [Suncus etruscus]|uniref:testis-specific H1 histone n=1 Tax=Suncus etruscus TaxID=109475 RepID=UPI00210F54EE|nr:testis-specific H1 histone [Suncus etruscus]
MAQEAGTSVEAEKMENQTQQPPEENATVMPRKKGPRNPRSVLQVSQVLLRAIAAHKGLTLGDLKKELGNAGYQVRRRSGSPSPETARPETKRGALLRVSGSGASGYFRVWKVPRPKPKRRLPKLEEAARSSRRSPARQRNPSRGQTQQSRRATRKARGPGRPPKGTVQRTRPRSKGPSQQPARSRAKDTTKHQPSKEVVQPRRQEKKRPSTKARKERKQEPQKATLAAPKQPFAEPVNMQGLRGPDCCSKIPKKEVSLGQLKTCDLKMTRSKSSLKLKSPANVLKTP